MPERGAVMVCGAAPVRSAGQMRARGSPVGQFGSEVGERLEEAVAFGEGEAGVVGHVERDRGGDLGFAWQDAGVFQQVARAL